MEPIDSAYRPRAADLVTSCTTAYVAGEDRYAPAVFPAILAIAHRDYDCVGGRGVEFHPDGRCRSLNRWLLDDTDFVRYPGGMPLPWAGYSYADDLCVPKQYCSKVDAQMFQRLG